jgi:hypothetical protein
MTTVLTRCALTLALLSLTACTTIESAANHARDFVVAHPVITAVAVGVVAGSIAVVADHHHHQQLPVRSEAGSCVIVVETLEGPIPKPC